MIMQLKQAPCDLHSLMGQRLNMMRGPGHDALVSTYPCKAPGLCAAIAAPVTLPNCWKTEAPGVAAAELRIAALQLG
jgi:hypothetical protein